MLPEVLAVKLETLTAPNERFPLAEIVEAPEELRETAPPKLLEPLFRKIVPPEVMEVVPATDSNPD